MTPDLINGFLDGASSILLWANVWRLSKDKRVRGTSIAPVAAIFLCGVWKMWYYPNLHQWASVVGAGLAMVANGVWVGQAVYYTVCAKRLDNRC